MRSFGSDNHSGIHPLILDAIVRANADHAVAYGEDPWSERAIDKLREQFGRDCEPYLMLNGTASNAIGLSALLKPYQAVICAETAHVHVDECGATERLTGCKLLLVPTRNGKITPDAVAEHLGEVGFEHHVQPGVVSISQATELGTVYHPHEIRALADFAHTHDMYLHMDGARLSNAAVALGTSLAAITRDAGVDALSFGGTKNGLMGADAVVFFRPEPAQGFRYRRKQGMQLSAKMRFVAAQMEAYLTGGLWAENAAKANAAAAMLADLASRIPGIELSRPVEINQVFVRIPRDKVEALQDGHFFYLWDESIPEARWMTSFDTTEDDIREFIGHIRKVLGKEQA